MNRRFARLKRPLLVLLPLLVLSALAGTRPSHASTNAGGTTVEPSGVTPPIKAATQPVVVAPGARSHTTAKPKVKHYTSGGSAFGSRRHRKEETLRDLVFWHSDEVAAYLENNGVTFDELHDVIYGRGRRTTIADLFADVDQGILTDVA